METFNNSPKKIEAFNNSPKKIEDLKKAYISIQKFDRLRELYGDKVIIITMGANGEIKKNNGVLGSILDFTAIEASLFIDGNFQNRDFKLYENPSEMLLEIMSLEGKGILFSLDSIPQEISERRKKEIEDGKSGITAFMDLQRRVFNETYGDSAILSNPEIRLDTLNTAYLYFSYFYPELLKNNVDPDNIDESLQAQIDKIKEDATSKSNIKAALTKLKEIRKIIKAGNLPIHLGIGIDPAYAIRKTTALAQNARIAKVSFEIVANFSEQTRQEAKLLADNVK